MHTNMFPLPRLLAFSSIIAVVLFSACQKQAIEKQNNTKTKAIARIDSLEKALKASTQGPAQTQSALRLAEAYQFFALDYKDDSLTVPYILKEGNIYSSFGDYAKAAELDKFVYDNYPKHPLRPNALFFLGNALHDAGDSSQCIVVFEKFAKEYPEHPYYEASVQMANFMKSGKDDLNKFIEKRAAQVADSLAKAKTTAIHP